MKSQAVFVEGAGMPGVSGDENVNRPAAPVRTRLGAAKLAGLVPAQVDEAFPPSGGSEKGKPEKSGWELPANRDVDMEEFLWVPCAACILAVQVGIATSSRRLSIHGKRGQANRVGSPAPVAL
jgi:hypothetical protein